MHDFTFQNPVRVHFGHEKLCLLGNELKQFGKRVLLTYGGGSIKKTGLYDRVVAAVKEAGEDYAVVVVGPPPMMKFTGIELLKNGFEEEKIWMSFERKMSCAIGKCGHCRIDEVYVCLDGPCFPYTVAKDLVD